MDFARLYLVLLLLAAGLGLIFGMRVPAMAVGDSGSLQNGVIQNGTAVAPVADPAMPDEPDYPVHWHAHLSLVDGQTELAVPAGVGLPAEGTRGPESPVHTHDGSGILHVEAQSRQALPPHTLAFFFSVWGQPLNGTCAASLCTDDRHQLVFFVNGRERLDWMTYDLADGDDVVFERVPDTVSDWAAS